MGSSSLCQKVFLDTFVSKKRDLKTRSASKVAFLALSGKDLVGFARGGEEPLVDFFFFVFVLTVCRVPC